jgi:murein DD-endopeptidase MepM/ murein hydrolase activator NlpD
VPRAHVVARGDTLGGIALRYHVSVAALVAANNLAGERARLRVGQRLVVPASAAPSAVARTARAPAAPPRAGPAGPPAAGRSPATPHAGAQAAAPPARAVDGARVVSARPPVVTRGPRGLELAVPDFADAAPAFAWPIEGAVTSTFGQRRRAWHRGIDIKAEHGAVVFAAAAGLVVASDVEPRYGRVVKIEHDDGFVTVYAHNDENLVQPGMRVALGDPIATVGRTGRATADHVHFEIRRNGAVYNPLYLLPLPARVGQVEESAESDEEYE